MGPLIGAALVKTGGDLLGSLFAPSPAKKLRLQRENEQKLREWSAGKITGALKPATPYYSSGNLPQLGSTAMSAVMGNLMQRLGPEMLAKWGINPTPSPVTTPSPLPNYTVGGVKPGFPGQDVLLKRYGAMAPGMV